MYMESSILATYKCYGNVNWPKQEGKTTQREIKVHYFNILSHEIKKKTLVPKGRIQQSCPVSITSLFIPGQFRKIILPFQLSYWLLLLYNHKNLLLRGHVKDVTKIVSLCSLSQGGRLLTCPLEYGGRIARLSETLKHPTILSKPHGTETNKKFFCSNWKCCRLRAFSVNWMTIKVYETFVLSETGRLEFF